LARAANRWTSQPTERSQIPRLSRYQVVAELRERERLGLVTIGEGDAPEATEAQLRQIALAGQRAAATSVAAAKQP
jgi:hypothetical protein